jgi:hypothetical protein
MVRASGGRGLGKSVTTTCWRRLLHTRKSWTASGSSSARTLGNRETHLRTRSRSSFSSCGRTWVAATDSSDSVTKGVTAATRSIHNRGETCHSSSCNNLRARQRRLKSPAQSRPTATVESAKTYRRETARWPAIWTITVAGRDMTRDPRKEPRGKRSPPRLKQAFHQLRAGCTIDSGNALRTAACASTRGPPGCAVRRTYVPSGPRS